MADASHAPQFALNRVTGSPFFPVMARLSSMLPMGGLALAATATAVALFSPGAARADWVRFTSRVSEVDACNQAQGLVPENSTVTTMKVRQFTDQQGYGFTCKVKWSSSPKAKPTRMPILFGPVWS